MINTRKILRKIILSFLDRSSHEKLLANGEKAVLRLFRRAASRSQAYRTLLDEAGIDKNQIQSFADFRNHCPILGKHNTFARFSIEELCIPGSLDKLASVLTSSGHGASFAYGLSTWHQAKHSIDDIDLGLQYAFQVDDRKTLLINCLPMGVGFCSRAVTIAETSVREDMVVALVTEVGPYYEQIIILGDPLFLKLLTDYARDKGIDWSKYRINLVIGEETFGEHYRDYLAEQFHVDVDDADSGMIGSSMGVGELGLNLFYETPQTIALRRQLHGNPEFFQALYGMSLDENPEPMLFVYNPLRSCVEVIDADNQGFGQLTISMTDRRAPIPMLRYQTGDVARVLPADEIKKACREVGLPDPAGTPLPIIAIKGRDKDHLPNGYHTGQIKDVLYRNRSVAQKLTGAFRVDFKNERMNLHVQLRHGLEGSPQMQAELVSNLPENIVLGELIVWPYGEFPYGMTLDYERKFTYYKPG